MRKIGNYFGTIPHALQNANLLKKRQENAEKKGERRVENDLLKYAGNKRENELLNLFKPKK